MIGRLMASRTSGGTGVGPGVKRYRLSAIGLRLSRPPADALSHAYYPRAMEPLFAFAAGLLALRLAGRIAGRWRGRRAPELLAWSSSLAAFAVAAAALAWGSAAGWDDVAFRVYYL